MVTDDLSPRVLAARRALIVGPTLALIFVLIILPGTSTRAGRSAPELIDLRQFTGASAPAKTHDLQPIGWAPPDGVGIEERT